MITLLQIKAARALLGWNQENLALAAGLSLPSINNLERGIHSPRPDTLKSIQIACEKAGVQFLDNNGVSLRPTDYSFKVLNGPDFIKELDEDIIANMTSADQEILAFSYDERKWIELAGLHNHLYAKARDKINWREKILIPETADFIVCPEAAYRMLPDHFFDKLTYEVYADRLALIDFAAMRVTIITNTVIADSYRQQFLALWDIAKPPSKDWLKKTERWK